MTKTYSQPNDWQLNSLCMFCSYESKQRLCPLHFSSICAALKKLAGKFSFAAMSSLETHSISRGEQAKQYCYLPWSTLGWYLQVCVWGWLVQTGKSQVELSSWLYAFWDLMMNLVRSQESGLDWAFPLRPDHVRSFLHGVDCAWTPGTHWQLLSVQKTHYNISDPYGTLALRTAVLKKLEFQE